MTRPSIPLAPPVIERRPVPKSAHGVAWSDDYAWLRAENWQEVLRDPDALAPEIRSVLDAENAYAEAVLAPTKDLQTALVAEMRGRIREDDSEPPLADGPWAYYSRFRPGGQHPILCRRPRAGGDETTLLDGDALAEGKTFFALEAARHAPDHAKLAWAVDDLGSELLTIRVRDLASGADLSDLVVNASTDIVWIRDSSGFLYVEQDESHRPFRVMLHRLGTTQAEDVEIFAEPDPAWFIGVGRSLTGLTAMIDVHGHDGSETHVVDLARPTAPPVLIVPRRDGHFYDVIDHGDRFFIRTNAGARDFKIVEAPRDAPGEANWRDFAPYRDGCYLIDAIALSGHLALLVREDSRPRLIVIDLESGARHDVAFDEPTYALHLRTVYEFDSPVIRFAYSSMARPNEIYEYDCATRARALVKRQTIPSGFDPQLYVTRLLFAPAPDGETVPVSLLMRRDQTLDGSAPLLLYGYGSYGHAIEAGFSTTRFSLVDRGFVYAIAHVRGGTEKGWRWYEDGKLEKKPNTFSDFIAAARRLIAEGYTGAGRIVAQGGSAGGLLMGVVANDAPDLFAGIIADVPFVDALATMMDETLPLTPPEWREWGDPISDAAAFATIRSYSPYDNVRAGRYPPIFALGGLTDPRVGYWEPAKWVARLRATMTGGGPVLFATEMGAGHGGKPGRFDQLEEIARNVVFALACVGEGFGEASG
jgi:oligopeptidase B